MVFLAWLITSFAIGFTLGFATLAHVMHYSSLIPKRPTDEPPSEPRADYASLGADPA